MKISKAIDVLDDMVNPENTIGNDEDKEAINLGIEALKLYMALKASGGVPRGFKGIGETPEADSP